MYTAWIDESQSSYDRDPGVYMLSAAVLEATHVDEARAAMRQLLLPRQRKLHWRDEGASRHEQIMKVIADLKVEYVIAVRCEPDTSARPERQRRLCLERLLPELSALGVSHAVAESRGPKDDKRDLAALSQLRSRQLMPGDDLRLDHLAGPADPLLWIPDACCGALTRHRCGDPTYFERIKRAVTILDVDR
jgi:hypothetical protein